MEATKPARHLGGEQARVPHLEFSAPLVRAVTTRATEQGLLFIDVVRAAIDDYAADAPPGDVPRDAGLPSEGVEGLATVWATGDSAMINSYLLALYQAGWSVREIAASTGAATGGVPITRQAVHRRAKRAPDAAPEGMPAVPQPGPRRFDRIPAAEKHVERQMVSLRVRATAWEAAIRRATVERGSVVAALERYLHRYLAGQFEAGATVSPADT